MKALQPTAYDKPSECSRELYPHPYITQKKKVSKKKAQETYVKDSLGRAFDEIKQKNSSNAKFQSLDDFLMEC